MDTITDFSKGDKLDLSGIKDVSQQNVQFVAQGGDAEVKVNGATVAILKGVNSSNLAFKDGVVQLNASVVPSEGMGNNLSGGTGYSYSQDWSQYTNNLLSNINNMLSSMKWW